MKSCDGAQYPFPLFQPMRPTTYLLAGSHLQIEALHPIKCLFAIIMARRLPNGPYFSQPGAKLIRETDTIIKAWVPLQTSHVYSL